jgi:ribosomal protein S18 acetylase RimI-like enzyme
VVSLSLPNNPPTTQQGLRPVHLRTDLAAIADLIELAFADSMDSSGRAAVREMRYLSKMPTFLSILATGNEMVAGISTGYVWIADGKLVGNVSISHADVPASVGKISIIANVAVHPDYRGLGIATRLMEASLEAVRKRGGNAILQVDVANYGAQHIYERLGFVRERAWTHWRRPTLSRIPPPLRYPSFSIERRRRSEWQAELLLAERLRPDDGGGIGWQRPVHVAFFRPSFWKSVSDLINLRQIERLIVRSADEANIHAALWIETSPAYANTQLTLLCDPQYAGLYDEALLNLAIRRFGARTPIVVEHPTDDSMAAHLLERYHFHAQRTLLHMRWQP